MDGRFRVVLNGICVRVLMRRKNYSYSQLAAELSTTVGYWTMAINGHKGIGPEMGKRITSHPLFRGRRWEDIFKMEEKSV